MRRLFANIREEFEADTDTETGERRDPPQHRGVASHPPHSFAMHMLYNHGHPKVNQALLGHEKSESSDVYTKVFSLDVAARQQVRFNRETGAVLQLQLATPAP